MKNKSNRMFRDQYGNTFFARTVKELRANVGGACSKMYREKSDGRTFHVGYVIGAHWLTEYAVVEREA